MEEQWISSKFFTDVSWRIHSPSSRKDRNMIEINMITPDERHVVWNHRSLQCLFNSLRGPTSKKHQSPHYLPFVRGIHRWPVNSLHKGPVTRKMFPADDVIMNKITMEGITMITVFLLHYEQIHIYIYISPISRGFIYDASGHLFILPQSGFKRLLSKSNNKCKDLCSVWFGYMLCKDNRYTYKGGHTDSF